MTMEVTTPVILMAPRTVAVVGQTQTTTASQVKRQLCVNTMLFFVCFFYQHATNLMHVYYSCGSTSSNCNLFCYYSHLCYWVCQWELCSARTMCVSASNIFLTLPISHDVVTYIGAPVDGRDSSAISVFPNQDAVSNTVFCRTITSTAQLSFRVTMVFKLLFNELIQSFVFASISPKIYRIHFLLDNNEALFKL